MVLCVGENMCTCNIYSSWSSWLHVSKKICVISIVHGCMCRRKWVLYLSSLVNRGEDWYYIFSRVYYDIIQTIIMTCKLSLISILHQQNGTNKTDRNGITEILLKVALNTINHKPE